MRVKEWFMERKAQGYDIEQDRDDHGTYHSEPSLMEHLTDFYEIMFLELEENDVEQ